MAYRVGINGFGRIGRQVYKAVDEGGFGVGVLVRNLGVHFFSIEARMATGSAPDRYIIIASRATSMQI